MIAFSECRHLRVFPKGSLPCQQNCGKDPSIYYAKMHNDSSSLSTTLTSYIATQAPCKDRQKTGSLFPKHVVSSSYVSHQRNTDCGIVQRTSSADKNSPAINTPNLHFLIPKSPNPYPNRIAKPEQIIPLSPPSPPLHPKILSHPP